MTEDRMKAWLDGWFYTLDCAQGRTRSTVVPVDYIPDHRPILVNQERGPMTFNRKPWNAEEDATLLEMRDAHAQWITIARAVGRSSHSVRRRYVSLREERNQDTYTGHHRLTKRVTPALKAKIVAMKADGHSYTKIAKALGLTVAQAVHHYHRIANRFREKAA